MACLNDGTIVEAQRRSPPAVWGARARAVSQGPDCRLSTGHTNFAVPRAKNKAGGDQNITRYSGSERVIHGPGTL